MEDNYITMTAKQIDKSYPIDTAVMKHIHELIDQGVEPNLSDPDAPEITDAPDGMLAGLVRRLRGRPRKESSLQKIDILLDQEDVSYLRATVKGWQTRLRGYVKNGMKPKMPRIEPNTRV